MAALSGAGAAVRSESPFRIEAVFGQKSLRVRLDGMYKRYRHGDVEVDRLVEEVKAALAMPTDIVTRGPFPRIVRAEDVAPGTVSFPFAPDSDLRIVLVKELPHGFLPITDTDLGPSDEPQVLLMAAIDNLRAISVNVPIEGRGEGEHLSIGYSTGDGYDAARVLLKPNLEAIADWLSGEALVAIPSANMLMMIGDSDPDFVQEAMLYTRSVCSSDTAPLSPKLFTLAELIGSPASG